MNLDIRIPIGLLFTLIGLLLSGYGLLYGESAAGIAAGWNINLAWGGVVLIFGIGMLLLAGRAARVRRRRAGSNPAATHHG